MIAYALSAALTALSIVAGFAFLIFATILGMRACEWNDRRKARADLYRQRMDIIGRY